MSAYTCLPLKYSTHTENCQLSEREKEPECTIYRLTLTHTNTQRDRHERSQFENLGQACFVRTNLDYASN